MAQQQRRRGRGEGSIHQRKDGLYAAVLDLGWSNGKRRRRTFYGKTRAEVRVKLEEAKSANPRRRSGGTDHTVETWLRYWLDEVAAERVRDSTLNGYRSKVDLYLVPLIGRHRLDRLEPADVRAMWRRMRQDCPSPDAAGRCPHKPSHALAEASLRQTHAILARALKVAVREQHVERNVATLVDPPGTETNSPTPLTIEQARKVLATVDEDDARAARWFVALYLGLRQGEALGLQWRDVDLDAGVLRVERTAQRIPRKGIVLGDPKSKTSKHTVPLPTVVLSRLTIQRARAADVADTAFVFGRTADDPFDPRRDWSQWKDLLARAEVPHVALRAARGTTASLLMAAGVPDRITAEILGHSNVQITRDVYQRGDVVQHREAMRALEAFVDSDAEGEPVDADLVAAVIGD